MGLSASQTRYLSLTARKTNVEFQGQQINHARTALANQSAELYTELMTLNPPVAPSVYKYIINPAELPVINWEEDSSYPLTGDKLENFLIYYAGNAPKFRDFNIPELSYREEKDAEGNVIKSGYCVKSYDEKGAAVYGNQYYAEDEIPGTYFINTEAVDEAGNKYNYNKINVHPNENFTYIAETGMFELKEDAPAGSVLPKWIQAYNLAMGQFSAYSAPTSLNLYETKPDDVEKATPCTYKFSATKSTNEAQYAAAMVQYEEDMKEYEEAIEKINEKTEEIHQSDKKLELQLKKLDTEQEAIQTEMEAVKKVIDKNIENTFKSFA